MRPTTAEKKDAAVHLLSQGLSIRKVAMQTGISSAAVGRIARDMPKRRRRKAGRPPLLSANDKRKITRDITSGSYDTAVQAAEGLARNAGVIVSANTVRRVLKENGLHSAQKIKKPMLSVRHRIARMEFAVRHKDWTVDDWRKVVWSDETKINRLGSDGREWCWKYRGESLSNRTCQPTVKHGGGSLMVWGCMTAGGIGYLTKIDGHLNADLYCEILRDELMKSLEYHDLGVGDIIFQQDNDPKHTSNKAKACMEELGLTTLQWPAQSPDLNPIEHLWSHLKHQLNGWSRQPTGMIELWERVEYEWENIPREVVEKLIDSMPRRVAAVLKAKGAMTNY